MCANCCAAAGLISALAAVGGDDTGVDGRTARYHRADRAGGLTGRVEEGRTRPQVVADDHPSREAAVAREPGRRRRRPELEQTRRTPAGLGQLVVELIRQKVLQRKHCADTDPGAHQGEQDNLRHEQPCP